MLKNSFSIVLLFFCLSAVNAQENSLPEGYDKITLDGKTAYMNLITGEVTYKLPKTKATKKVVKKEDEEYNPFVTHIVQKGETLYKIARKYEITIQQIYKYNNSDANDHLYVGQEIVVGLKTPIKILNKKIIDAAAKYHIVKSNETLYRISVKYKLSVAKLKRINRLKSNAIFVGQKLLLK